MKLVLIIIQNQKHCNAIYNAGLITTTHKKYAVIIFPDLILSVSEGAPTELSRLDIHL